MPVQYPSIQPYMKTLLEVDTLKNGDPVKIYVEMSGNKDGIPVIYLHGGPGDHSDPSIRRLFNPKLFNIIQFDQRGCGQSVPLNHTEKNTTQHLIKDMEAIRKLIRVPKFLVAGGSWGTTLALAYAEAHPVLGLILRGVFDLSMDDCVMKSMYPDLEAKLKRIQRKKTISQILKTHNKTRTAFIKASNDPRPMYVNATPHDDDFRTQQTLSIIGTHYEGHDFFLTKRNLYRKIDKLNVPVIIVQGRYDIVTPPIMAYTLCKKLPNCQMMLVKAGHTHFDLTKELVKASDAFATFFSKR